MPKAPSTKTAPKTKTAAKTAATGTPAAPSSRQASATSSTRRKSTEVSLAKAPLTKAKVKGVSTAKGASKAKGTKAKGAANAKGSKVLATAKRASGTAGSRKRRPFRVGRSKTAGFGLFATREIGMGDFIAFYQGRKISNAEADKRGTRYMFELNSRWTIDGANRRNLARYINHSCNANAESDVKKGKIIITARKTIQPETEITIDYGRDYFDTFIKAKGCRCAACGAKSMVLRSPAKSSGKSSAKSLSKRGKT
jgi:hypothetical protein